MHPSSKSRPAGVWQAGTAIANTWLLVDDEGRRVLVDTGHRTERALLQRGLARLGVRAHGDLDLVLLTHRHSDHAGNADWLRAHFGAELACHVDDRAILEGDERAPRLAGRGAALVHDLLCRVEDHFPTRARVDRTLQDGESLLGFEVIHVGGHTEGSVLYFHRASGTAFTGDALLSGVPVQRLLVQPRLAYPAYSVDGAACRANTRAWLRRRPRLARVCAGHGPMMSRRIDEHLDRLARPLSEPAR